MLLVTGGSVASHSGAAPPPGSQPRMMTWPSQVAVDAGFLDRVQEPRLLDRSTPRRADAEHVGGVGAGADGQVDVAADHARVVAAGTHGRVGRSSKRRTVDEASL